MQQEPAGQARRLGEQSEVSGQIPGECTAKSRLRLDIPQVKVHMGAVCGTAACSKRPIGAPLQTRDYCPQGSPDTIMEITRQNCVQRS
jgi:hypothetical protein